MNRLFIFIVNNEKFPLLKREKMKIKEKLKFYLKKSPYYKFFKGEKEEEMFVKN